MQKFLFVCLGNICRSPSAETIFKALADKAGYACKVDSAGTYGGHAGEPSDSRMRRAAAARGYTITSHSRQVRTDDFYDFDVIVAMDDRNWEDLRALAPDLESRDKVCRMADYSTTGATYVPDPYYGGAEGFNLVIDILEDSCAQLLKSVQE